MSDFIDVSSSGVVSAMKYLLITAVLLGCALADSPTDRLFLKAGGNQTVCLDKEQFSSAWLFLDTDSDGSVSKQEFDTSWGRLNLPERDQAPGDFVEIDTNKDLVITTSDLEYLFRVFDENADNEVCIAEWRQNFRGLFNLG